MEGDAKRSRGYVYVCEGDEEEEEEEERKTPCPTLCRHDSVFLRSETVEPPVVSSALPAAPDWQRAWTNFLSATSEQRTFYYNPLLKGAWCALHFFLSRFEATVSEAVISLVEDIDLEPDKKRIRPCDIGGLAGGQKFLHKNVFFKFAFDHFGMYDGDDQLAAKAAGRELANLGVIANLSCNRRILDSRGKINSLPPVISNLFVPFAVTVDYLGFRIFASTILPISRETIVYGSQDGGKTFVICDKEAESIAKSIAENLNLKLHKIGRKGEFENEVYLAADVEFHKGKDGKIWILDLARLLPPFPPTEKKNRHLILCNFFSPLVVKENSMAISADVFSGFNRTNSAKNDNAEARQMADNFFGKFCAIAQIWDEENLFFVQIRNRFGVNARFLSRFYPLVKKESVKFEIAFEMVHRTAKCFLRNFHSADELFAQLRKIKSGADLKSAMAEKYSLPMDFDYSLFDTVALNLTRTNRDLGIVENERIEPVITRIATLTEIFESSHDDFFARHLQRNEAIGRLNLERNLREFDSGFWAVLKETGLENEEARKYLETQRKLHYLA